MKPSVKLTLLVVLCCAQWARAQTVTDVTNIADYPYAAYIEYYGGSGNGAIVSDTQVLAAASILDVAAGANIKVYVGNAMERSGTRFVTSNFQKHPLYNATTLENDVAIITIGSTFKGLPNVKPIPMGSGAIVSPVNCFMIGWGIYTGLGSPYLRRINYQFVTDQECATALRPQPPSKQCASAKKGSGAFYLRGDLLVCDNQLYGLLSAAALYSFTDAQPIDLFTKLTTASVREFVLRLLPRKNYVSCS